MAKMGRPQVQDPIARKISIRFSVEEYNKLSDYAKTHNVSVAQVVRAGVKEYLENNCK